MSRRQTQSRHSIIFDRVEQLRWNFIQQLHPVERAWHADDKLKRKTCHLRNPSSQTLRTQERLEGRSNLGRTAATLAYVIERCLSFLVPDRLRCAITKQDLSNRLNATGPEHLQLAFTVSRRAYSAAKCSAVRPSLRAALTYAPLASKICKAAVVIR